MAAKHRTPDHPHDRPDPRPRTHPYIRAGVVGHLQHLRLVLTVVNTIAGMAFAMNQPGTSASFDLFRFIAPLSVWSIGFFTAAALLAASMWREPLAVWAHVIASTLWLIYAAGAVNSLLTASSPSPTGTITVTGLVVGAAGYHSAALWFRRKLARDVKAASRSR